MNAGADFVKKIRPLGAALFLIVAVLVTVICLTAGTDPIPGYEPPESMDYYAQNLEQLCAELEANVFPQVDGVLSCAVTGDTVTVTIRSDVYAVTRAAILRYFDADLFTFVESQEGEQP